MGEPDNVTAYSEAHVVPVARQGNKATAKRTRRAVVVPQHPELVCRHVVRVQVDSSHNVQLLRDSIAAGRKVLLSTYRHVSLRTEGLTRNERQWLIRGSSHAVADYIDTAVDILAVRDAVTKLGAEVVGVGVVAATSATVLDALKREQVLFSCAWTPPRGVVLAATGDNSVTRSIVPTGDTVVVDDRCSCYQPAPHRVAGSKRKRKRHVDEDDEDEESDTVVATAASLPFLSHVTAHYQVRGRVHDGCVREREETLGS